MEHYDVAVIGLGGMGSAAAAHLARRGARVIALEQFPLLHDLGASSGRTRIIRKAYFEDVAYVPLLERAYELWRQLEQETGRTLLNLCGCLVVGNEEAEATKGVQFAAERFGIPIRVMETGELRRAYPQVRPLDDEIGVLESEAGIVFPEVAVGAHLDVARERGATIAENARVTNWHSRGSAVVIEMDGGHAVQAQRVITCAGPWTPEVFTDLELPIVVQRNVQYWFWPETGAFTPDRFPTFLLDRAGLPAPMYGFPDLGDGVKAALHGFGHVTTADDLERDVQPSEVGKIRELLAAWMPGAAGELRSVKACMYSLTPDKNFIIGPDPLDERIIIGAGFSGHGFKFASVVGELLAQLALDGDTELDISFLSPDRFVEELQ